MELWMPGATHVPLGLQTEPSIGVPRILIFHTMVGYLMSTERMFKNAGYSGTESTFGVGGPHDGASLDGAIRQWQELDNQADAQYDGNAYATSIETSDGGHPLEPWSDKQLESLIDIGVWWCRQTKHSPRLVSSPSESGFGYHAQFPVWNRAAHSCPGETRIRQLKGIIIPECVKRLDIQPPTWPQFPLPSGAFFGNGGVMSGHNLNLWQEKMRRRGWTISIDGIYGPQTRDVALAFQREKHLIADGLIGKQTWDAAWKAPIT